MIQMTNGFTCVDGKLIDAKSGPVQLSPEAEERLVSFGVAEYVGVTEQPAEKPLDGGKITPKASVIPPKGKVATGAEKPPVTTKPVKPKAKTKKGADQPPELTAAAPVV